MTTLSFRLEESLKENVNLLAELPYAPAQVQVQRGYSGQSFHCLWPETAASAVPRSREVFGTAAHPE